MTVTYVAYVLLCYNLVLFFWWFRKSDNILKIINTENKLKRTSNVSISKTEVLRVKTFVVVDKHLI